MIKRAARGEAYAFLMEHKAHEGRECVEWPFAMHKKHGYGVIGIGGKTCRVHREMCRMVHGEPPFPKADAAHSCNNRRCINRNHLRWDTRAGNLADRLAAGTLPRGTAHALAALTEDQVLRAVAVDTKAEELAAEFGVCRETITSIRLGRHWTWLTGIERKPAAPRVGQHSPNHRLTNEQVRAIYHDRRSQSKIAGDFGCDQALVSRIKNGKLWATVTGHQSLLEAGA